MTLIVRPELMTGYSVSEVQDSSLLFYHISSVIDFSSEKYMCSTGHKDSWYLQSEFSDDA